MANKISKELRIISELAYKGDNLYFKMFSQGVPERIRFEIELARLLEDLARAWSGKE